jgi:hypothetical protein
MPQSDEALAGLVKLWLAKVKKACEHKKKVFGDDADEAMRFYNAPNYNWMYGEGGGNDRGRTGVSPLAQVPSPTFKMTLNKVAEMVQIFGPILYAKNPIRQVNPRPPAPFGMELFEDPAIVQLLMPPELAPMFEGDPMAGQMLGQAILGQEDSRLRFDTLKANLLAAYLNWTPNELRLSEHARKAIDEALIKGRGCLWTETYTPPGSQQKFVGSFYDSVDFLAIDPDAEQIEDAWWIARKCSGPYWDVERLYGLEPGSLKDKGVVESQDRQVSVDAFDNHDARKRGTTNDLVCYWKVWTRMGVGGRLSGSDQERDRAGLLPGDLAGLADTFDEIVGDHAFLVLCDGVDYPLNLPPSLLDAPAVGPEGEPGSAIEEVRSRLSWDLPLWADGQWPVSVLDFHPVPRCPWPMAHIKPAMGELKALNWLYSFMVGKIQVTLRDIVAVLKELSEEFKVTVLEGADLSVVELDAQNRSISECVQVLQFPQMNADVWRIIEAIEVNFEKRVGLNEVFYGRSTTQIRSATEADMKAQHLNIRPDDMAERVESWMTLAARKEAIAARLLLSTEDVRPIIGPVGAQLWEQLVTAPPGDPAVFRELEYRIEAGSTRKPNKEREIANANEAMQAILPLLDKYASMTGFTGPLNYLLEHWAKSRDMDPRPLMLPEQPPPMPGQDPTQQPAGEPAPDGGP